MKYLELKFSMMPLAMLLIVLLALPFVGCSVSGNEPVGSSSIEEVPWTRHGHGVYVKTIDVDGHRYVLFSGCRQGGIVHAESCACKSGRK